MCKLSVFITEKNYTSCGRRLVKGKAEFWKRLDLDYSGEDMKVEWAGPGVWEGMKNEIHQNFIAGVRVLWGSITKNGLCFFKVPLYAWY